MQRRIVVAPVLFFVVLRSATGQDDPLEVQRRSVEAIEKFRTTQRQSGAGNPADLMRIADELATSANALEARQKYAEAAVSAYQSGRARKLSNHPSAEASYERARVLAAKGQDRDTEAKALFGLALIALQVDKDFGRSAEFLRNGIAIARDIPGQVTYGELLDLRGELENKLRNFRASMATYSELIELLERRGDVERSFTAFAGRFSAYFDSGVDCTLTRPGQSDRCIEDLRKAETDARRAKQAAESLGWHFLAEVMESQLNLVRLQIRNTEIAGSINEEKRKTELSDASPSITRRQQEVIDASAAEARRVEEIRKRANVPVDPALQRAIDEGFRSVEKQNRPVPESGETPNNSSSPEKPARIGFLNPRNAKEVLLMDIAPPADQNLGTGLYGLNEWMRTSPEPKVRQLFVQAQSELKSGAFRSALHTYYSIIELLERDRFTIPDDLSRSEFMVDKSAHYSLLARNFLAINDYEKAFSLMEKNRARTLGELLAARSPALRTSREREVYANLVHLQALVRKDQDRAYRTADPEYARTLRERDRVLADIERESPRMHRLVRTDPVKFADLQKFAAAQSCDILQYDVTDAGVVIWHAGPGSTRAVRVVLSRQHLSGKVEALMRGVRDGRVKQYDQALAQELYLFLLSPVRDQLSSGRNLYILATGELGQLPFQLLKAPDASRPLGEQFRLAYVPSAEILLRLPEGNALGMTSVATVAHTLLKGETDAIEAMFQRHTHLRGPAKSDLLAKLNGFEAVHFMAHGSVERGAPMLSGIQLRPGSQPISAAEMFALPLDGTRVVSIAACRSGNVESLATNEIYGIARALLYAGAQSMVLASWDVDSAAAALYMKSFYSHAAKAPLAEAARLALTDVRQTYPEPYYWGAFQYIGR